MSSDASLLDVPDGWVVPDAPPAELGFERTWRRDAEVWTFNDPPQAIVLSREVLVPSRGDPIPWEAITAIRVTRHGDAQAWVDLEATGREPVELANTDDLGGPGGEVVLWMAGHVERVRARRVRPEEAVDDALVRLRGGGSVGRARGQLAVTGDTRKAKGSLVRTVGVEGERWRWRRSIADLAWLVALVPGVVIPLSLGAGPLVEAVGIPVGAGMGFGVLSSCVVILITPLLRRRQLSFDTHQLVLPDGTRVPWWDVHRVVLRRRRRGMGWQQILEADLGDFEEPFRLAQCADNDVRQRQMLEWMASTLSARLADARREDA